MYKKIYSLVFTLLITVLTKSTFSQTCGWTLVGSGAASNATYTTHNDLALSSLGVPYISYCDGGSTNALTVKTYSGSTWNTVGSLGSFINSSYTSIALNGTTPYVAFADGSNGSRLTVKTYSAGIWNNVGTTLTTGTSSFVTISIYGGTPYVAYADGGNGNRATVKTYSAGVWSILGAAVSTSSASSISMSIDNFGTPYIIYVDIANSSLATVKKYNGTAWVVVGTGTVSTGAVSETKIDVSYNNIPYIAYFGSSWVCSINTFTAGSWQAVGTGTVGNVYQHLALAVDPLGTPYISYYDLGPYKCSVSKYDGTTWGYVGGSTGISLGTPNNNNLAINSSGTPYVTFGDGSFGAYVKRLVSSTTITNPNPITLCSGASGMMSTAVTNTVAGMTYQWQVNPGSGFTNVVNGPNYSGATTASLSLNAMTTAFNTYQYRCVVNDLCTNIISSSALLTVNPTPTLTVNSSTICSGATTTITAAGATTYSWNTGATTSSIMVSPFTTTTYTVTGTSLGCSSTKTVTVTVNTSPVAGMNSNSPVCVGSSINFVNTSTGTIVSYSWSGPNGFVSTLQNPSITNATSVMAGTYSQTVTASNGCTNSAIVNVIVNALPTVIISPATQTICAGNSATLAASGATTYSWNTSQTTSTISVSPTTTTGYTVTGTSASGCAKTVTANVIVNSLPTLTITASSSTLCVTDTVILTATGANTYTWNTGATTTTVAVGPTSTTTYSVIGTNSFGCTNNASKIITVISSKTFSGTVTSSGGSPFGNMILYKYKPTLSQWDSVTFTPYSSIYNFSAIDKGDYVIKAVPSSSTMQVTYGTGSISWQGATVITHGCLSNSTASINVIPLSTFTTTGSGSLSGTITQTVGFGQKSSNVLIPGQPIGGIIVKGGKNPGGNMFVQTTTAADGTYTLSGLPDNIPGEEYFILVDIAGLDTNLTYHKFLISGSNQLTGLDFTVDSMKINPVPYFVGIHDLSAIEHQIQVFPNPASSSVNIQYTLQSSALVKIELFDILCKSVKNILPSTSQSANKHSLFVKTDDLNSGIYFIKLSINNTESVIKLFVTE